MIDTNEIFSIIMDSPLGEIKISGTDEYINEISFSDNPSGTDTPEFLPEIILKCKKGT